MIFDEYYRYFMKFEDFCMGHSGGTVPGGVSRCVTMVRTTHYPGTCTPHHHRPHGTGLSMHGVSQVHQAPLGFNMWAT